MKLYAKLRKIMLKSDIAIVAWLNGPAWKSIRYTHRTPGRHRTADGHMSTMQLVDLLRGVAA